MAECLGWNPFRTVWGDDLCVTLKGDAVRKTRGLAIINVEVKELTICKSAVES